MHAALARLVNNEETRKREKINQIPKRSSREAELSPRGAAPRLEAPRLGRAQVGGVGARREESNEEFREHVRQPKKLFGWLWRYKTRRRA